MGRYFEIPGLQQEAKMFLKANTAAGEAGTYFEHAKLFHDDHVYANVVDQCLHSIRTIKVDSLLMKVSDAEFWLDVLEAGKSNPNPDLSTLVSSFCWNHKEFLDAETFSKLTENSVLPELSAVAAVELVRLEKHFDIGDTSTTELSSLQERGLEALISSSKNEPLVLLDLQRYFQVLPPPVLSQMLQRTMSKLWDCNTRQKLTVRVDVPKDI